MTRRLMLRSQVLLVLRLNSNILYEYQWWLCKLFRYASPRPNCVSDYKSTSHDSEASALSHSVAMGWRLSTRPADQKTIKTCSEGPMTPSMAEHLGNTWPLHKQGGTCTHTHRQHRKRHTWELINIWPPIIPCLQALFPGLFLWLYIASLSLCSFGWKHDMENKVLSSKLQPEPLSTRKEKWKTKTGFHCIWSIILLPVDSIIILNCPFKK